LPGRAVVTLLNNQERRDLCIGRLAMLCIEGDFSFFDALFTFTAFLLVFTIGSGLGLLARGE
jgi:hypothetical protein